MSSPGCSICYSTSTQLDDSNFRYDECSFCGSPFCADCLKDWMVQQVNGRHFKKFSNITLKCHAEKCQNLYELSELQHLLGPRLFEEVDQALTLKIMRSSDQYISCPNSRCGNFGFLNDTCCSENIHCTQCKTQWKLPCQPSKGFLTNYINFDQIYNNNTQSDLYKVMFAQMCPSCKVMIVRSEGCKFMECAKCKFQFCWFCLSDFYTEYHYYESHCPLRIVPIYGVIILGLFLLYLKIFYISEMVSSISVWLFSNILAQGTALFVTILILNMLQKMFGIANMAWSAKLLNSKEQQRQIQRAKSQIKAESISLGVQAAGLLVSFLFIQYVIGSFSLEYAQKILLSIPLHLGLAFGKFLYSEFRKRYPIPELEQE